jgi:hypothetical protein
MRLSAASEALEIDLSHHARAGFLNLQTRDFVPHQARKFIHQIYSIVSINVHT